MGELLLNWGLALIYALQALGEGFAQLMALLSSLGVEEFYLILAPALYWLVSGPVGLRLALLLNVSSILNAGLKMAFHLPRPYWADPAVLPLAAEATFGLPSGHAQHAVAVWGGIARSFNRRWLWWLCVALVLLISMSRLALGVHFPIDVLAGWLVGGFLLWAAWRVEKPLLAWLHGRSFIEEFAIALAGSLALLGLGLLGRVIAGDWQMPAEWLANATRNGLEAPTPFDLTGIVSNAGVVFGGAFGAFCLPHLGLSLAGVTRSFSNPKELPAAWQMAARYVIGLFGVLLLWRGLGLVFAMAGETGALSFILRYLRYSLIGWWIIAGSIWVFRKFRL